MDKNSENNTEITEFEINWWACCYIITFIFFIIVINNENFLNRIMSIFEKKDYQPIVLNNELYAINKKNGKTYKLVTINNKMDNYEYSYYKYIAKPKGKRNITKRNDDPLDIRTNGF